ncbi:MAG: hypothetical protein M3Y87_03700 [Myxococcota bacterium]|nr:hypothetical protein [Myxococcota bacterium]
MGGRFLFGDSEPFPGGFDFLAALRKFVAASSRTLTLAHEADELERTLGDRAQEHLHAIDALQAFFDGLGDVIAERAARSGAPQIVGPHASQLLDQVEVLAAQARAARAKDLDADQVGVTSRIRERRAEIRAALSEYLLGDPLPVLSWALSLGLAGTAPHGTIILSHPGELMTSFALDVGAWASARKIGDLSPGLTMQVGFKKAFLRSSLHPDIVVLDEFVIAALELGPDSMEIHLRRKLDAPRDSFVLTVDPDDASGLPIVKVTRFDERGGDNDAPFTVQGEQATRVQELATMLRGECSALIGRKKRLLSAQLDGHDVFERNLVTVLLQRISDRLAPTAFEVSRHSPNPNELSLKYERDDGRREELYLRKSDLLALVAGLPPEALQMYQRLAFLPLPTARPQLQIVAESQGRADVEVDIEEESAVYAGDSAAGDASGARPSGLPPSRSAPPPPKRKW